ncbi:formate dehydrogenase accessory sulfurtransferase FdhD [Methylocystis bryophila]|uniref:Sulfur carrier protein FdhD n=1 Tax=Methylocystis bryophila TaxID=655015 RepID=A0A1W6MZL0_9HYPH|nr:formate dehydrogenase accessory sulfurtransferase FdhD [Methylocystis bryophila]ARN83015.1 sufurtransferase FdhD [Methylocystis bryophila]BDV39315.1 sulfurtransferase FdhD [Methylocystis bryophila]
MSEGVPAPVAMAACLARRHDELTPGSRLLPEETPIAFTYGGSTHAVMMATPADLEDFAAGFALTEGLIDAEAGALEVEIVASDLGVELRSWLPGEGQRQYAARRRSMAGPTGCGLCGVESLEQAIREPPRVGEGFQVQATEMVRAMERLSDSQTLNQQTRAVHGAAFWRPSDDLLMLREDVGRHNALDKLVGALLRRRVSGKDGVVLMTSRVSVELIQKAARIGAPVIAAISAPTALAVRTAEACGMTLVAVMRGRDFEVFTHPERIVEPAPAHVA